jgi:hypothetical protein
MTFNANRLDVTGSGSKGAGAFGIYSSATDDKATILTNGYFDTAWNELQSCIGLMIEASDETFLVGVASVEDDVTLTELGTLVGTGLATATDVGAINAALTDTALTIDRLGPGVFRLNFTLDGETVTVTDGGGSGSHGSLKLFDLAEGAWVGLGCRQDYTAFAEGAALTGAAGDAVFEIGVGSTAIAAAADGTLAAANDDLGGDVNVTLSGGTGTGTGVNGPSGTINGTAAAGDIFLNWSGTAATIDATSTIDVTGTISLILASLGDD